MSDFQYISDFFLQKQEETCELPDFKVYYKAAVIQCDDTGIKAAI